MAAADAVAAAEDDEVFAHAPRKLPLELELHEAHVPRAILMHMQLTVQCV